MAINEYTNGESTVAAVLILFVQVVMVTDSLPASPFCRSDGVMRTMNTEKLLKTVPIIQNQMDVLLDFNVSFLCFLSPVCHSLRFSAPPPLPLVFNLSHFCLSCRWMRMNSPTVWSTPPSCSSSRMQSGCLLPTMRASSTSWVKLKPVNTQIINHSVN